MKLKIKSKTPSKKRKTAGTARGKDVALPTLEQLKVHPWSTSSKAVNNERVKTSVIVTRSLMVEAQRVAREMGISYNGFHNLALYEKLRSLDSTGAQRPPALHAPEVQDALRRRPRSVSEREYTGLGGYALPSDDSSGQTPADFAPWDVVERYAKAQLKHPHDNFLKMARRLAIAPGVARAADIAQESPEFERYLKKKAKAS